MNAVNHYSFYNIVGDVPFQYEIVYKGELILSGRYVNITNKNACFSFDFVIQTSDETVSAEQLVVNWDFSGLKSHNISPLFSKLWNAAAFRVKNNLAYSVMLQSDNILSFDKKGQINPAGYFLEIVLPIIDFKNNVRSYSYQFGYTNAFGEERNVDFTVNGWNFFIAGAPDDTDTFDVFLAQDRLVEEIYTIYEKKNKDKNPTLFWLQTTKSDVGSSFLQKMNTSSTIGMYIINLDERLVEQAYILTKMEVILPFITDVAYTPIKVELDGAFTLRQKNVN
ncbi:hypothetical protein SAMN02745150_00810 [Brevinema andersonii]|uniref:Uncharacterized protein n=2 Tax=Brevinema andersonii TaxID=34097 RepID=A0A1I1E1J5_BREAD|nr:hypothetical protein SAMN02745150_00810 [Brevinema andersonii]